MMQHAIYKIVVPLPTFPPASHKMTALSLCLIMNTNSAAQTQHSSSVWYPDKMARIWAQDNAACQMKCCATSHDLLGIAQDDSSKPLSDHEHHYSCTNSAQQLHASNTACQVQCWYYPSLTDGHGSGGILKARLM